MWALMVMGTQLTACFESPKAHEFQVTKDGPSASSSTKVVYPEEIRSMKVYVSLASTDSSVCTLEKPTEMNPRPEKNCVPGASYPTSDSRTNVSWISKNAYFDVYLATREGMETNAVLPEDYSFVLILKQYVEPTGAPVSVEQRRGSGSCNANQPGLHGNVHRYTFKTLGFQMPDSVEAGAYSIDLRVVRDRDGSVVNEFGNRARLGMEYAGINTEYSQLGNNGVLTFDSDGQHAYDSQARDAIRLAISVAKLRYTHSQWCVASQAPVDE